MAALAKEKTVTKKGEQEVDAQARQNKLSEEINRVVALLERQMLPKLRQAKSDFVKT
jgi:hypothetical protein